MTQAGYLELVVDSTSVTKGEKALDSIARTGSRTEKSMKGDMSEIERAMARLGQQSTKIDKTINASLSQTAAISKTVARGLASLVAGITSVAAIKQAVTEARNFNAAMSETATLLDGTPAQMEALRKSAMDLARAYGGSSTDQVKAFYQAISAGAGDVKNAAQLLDQANKLAIGGVTNVTTGVDALTTAMNAYAADGLTAAQASDALFVGMKAGKTTVGELSASLGQVVPIAAAAGVSFDEIVAGVSSLTTQGQTTAMATTGLRQVIASVVSPTKQATDMAAQLGIAFNAQALEADGLAAFLDQVVKKTGGNTAAMAQLFGSVEALNAALAFAGGAGGKFSEIMAEMSEKAGATDEAFGKVAGSLDKRLSFALGKIGVLVTQFGTAILTMTVPAVEAMAAAAEFLSQNFDSVTGVAISSAAALTAYYLPTVYGAVTATGAWVASLITLKGALLATGIGALVVGAGLLVGEFLKLVRATGGWGNALSLLGDVASGVWEGIKGSAKSIVPALGAVWADMQAGFVHVLEAMSLQWGNFLWGLGSKLDGIPLFGSMAQGLKDASDRAIDGMVGLNAEASALEGKAIRLRNEAASMATDGFDVAREAARKLSEVLAETEGETGDTGDQAAKLKKILDLLNTSTGKTGKSLKSAKDEAKAFADALLEAADTAEELGTKKANILIGGIDGVSGAWGDFVARGFSDFKGFTKSVLNSFTGMLSDMIALAARNKIMLSMGLSATGAAGSMAMNAATGGSGLLGGLLGNVGGSVLGGGMLGGISTGLGGILSGGGLGASFANLGGLMTGSVGGWGAIGAAIPAVGLLAVGLSALIGKTKELDRGVRVTIDGFDALVEAFRETRTSRLFGLIKRDRTSYAGVSDEVSDPILAAVAEIQGNVLSMTDILGIGAGAFSDFTTSISISTKDLTDEEIAAAIQEQLTQIADEMADLALASFDVIQNGETASAALERLSTRLTAVDTIADTLGHTFDQTGVSGAALASNLVDAFGGLDAMNAATTTYYQAFYSEAERQAITLRQMTEALSELNITMPRSRDSYRELIEAQDLTSERGQEVYAALISMAAGMDQVLPSISALTGELEALYGTTETGLNAFVSAAQVAARANASAAADWYKASDSIRDYIDKLRGSSTAITSPFQARAFNEMKFQTTLASALAGDLDAAGNMTSVAENLRQSVYSTASSRLEAARAEARIMSGLNQVSGIGDIEGARHDQISGLLTVQADLAQETIDYIAAGNVLTEDMIDTLQSQLGSLGGAIDYLSAGNVLTEDMINTLQSQLGSLGGEIGALMGGNISLLGDDIDLSMSAFSDASGVLTRALSDLRGAVQEDIALRAAAADQAAKEQAFNTFAAKLGSHDGTLIANEDQLRSLARAGGLDATGSVAAVQARVAGFSGSDGIDQVVSGSAEIRDYLFSVFQNQYVPTTNARYGQWYYGLPASHYDKYGRDEILTGARSFKPRAFDWSAIGIDIPGYDAGGTQSRTGFAHIGENDIELVAPSRIYNPSETKAMLDNRELAKLLRDLLDEVAGLRDENAAAQRALVRYARNISELQDKVDALGMPVRNPDSGAALEVI